MIKRDEKRSLPKAVALRYRPSRDPAPRVMAKGAGLVAQKIIDLGREHGIPIQEDPATLDGAPGLAARDAAAGGDEAIDSLAVVGGAGVEREALHQASAEGQPAQPAPRGASQAGAFFRESVAWKPEPFKAKALALITFLAGDPQASCLRSGGAEIFWSVSKRPHRAQSYS